MMTLDQSILSQYPDGSKCMEFVADLTKSDTMTWDAVYWRAKYLFEYGAEVCTTQEMIRYVNECFNQGLSANANQACYIDARRMAAVLYNLIENYEQASNCIQVVLDITEDVPVDMFLDLNYADIHTDTLRQILQNSSMFFNDLHMADGHGVKYEERQKEIVKEFLLLAAGYKSKNPSAPVDIERIEKEVAAFGLSSADEWNYFKEMIGAVTSGTRPPAPIIKPVTNGESKEPVKTEVKPVDKPEAKTETKPKKKNRSVTFEIFPEDDNPTTKGKDTETGTDDSKKTDSITQNPPKQGGIDLEGMLASIMALVKQNAEQIAALQGKGGDDAETARIAAELEERKAKEKELLGQIESAQSQLALSEEQKAVLEEQKAALERQKKDLEKTVEEQTLIIDEKRSIQFKDEELKAFEVFTRVILIDTCSIENELELLDYVQPNEMVRVSQVVIDELENHKKNGDSERKKIGQRALKAIRGNKYSVAFDYEHAYPALLPEAYRIKDDDNIGTKNDKYIFSAALRYKLHTNLAVILISDDVTVQAMAISEHIETMSAAEFIAGKEKYVPAVAPLTEEEYLAKKLKAKDFSLNMSEIQTLWGYKIITYGDFINASEESISFIKDKKGINLGNRLLLVHKRIKADYEHRYKTVVTEEEDGELF